MSKLNNNGAAAVNLYNSYAVAGLIELLMNYHNQGLRVLLGLTRPPRGRAVHDMMAALDARPNVKCYSLYSGRKNQADNSRADKVIADNERFNEIVTLAGGWANIIKACRQDAHANKLNWRLMNDYINLIGTYTVKHTTRLGLLAAKYDMTVLEVIQRRRNFAFNLALFILTGESLRNFK